MTVRSRSNVEKSDRSSAETCFRKAVEIARTQEARLLELRAATDLARLWRDAGSPNDPLALLEPILAAIEGGESTRDVRNARALLAGSAARSDGFPATVTSLSRADCPLRVELRTFNRLGSCRFHLLYREPHLLLHRPSARSRHNP